LKENKYAQKILANPYANMALSHLPYGGAIKSGLETAAKHGYGKKQANNHLGIKPLH